MGEIKFGTDGWRAVIAEDFTFANFSDILKKGSSAMSRFDNT